MISLCQEGKSSPDALGRSANKSLQVSPARLRASRRWFLFDREPDIHLLSRPPRAAQKIEFVISCQSRNNSMGASGAYAPSLSRLLTRPGRLRAEEILLTSMISPCQEGKSSPDALGRSANKVFRSLQLAFAPLGGDSSSIENQTSICCLGPAGPHRRLSL